MRPVLVIALMGLAACAAPLRDTPRLGDAPVAEGAGQAAAVDGAQAAPDPAPAPRTGLLGLFSRRAAARMAEAPAVGGPSAPVAAGSDAPVAATAAGVGTDAGAGQAAAAEAAGSPPEADGPARRGIFAALFGGGRASTTVAEPDAPPTGGRPPYGEIARLCDTRADSVGTRIARHPEAGGGYALYDSAPGQTGLRSFYLDGFSDGCLRHFTAALAIFGDPELYERVRFTAAGETQPLGETDAEYDRIKRRVCGAGADQPCGDRVGRLAGDTVFVSVYETFGSSPRWKNLLLHDGAVAALDIKSR